MVKLQKDFVNVFAVQQAFKLHQSIHQSAANGRVTVDFKCVRWKLKVVKGKNVNVLKILPSPTDYNLLGPVATVILDIMEPQKQIVATTTIL